MPDVPEAGRQKQLFLQSGLFQEELGGLHLPRHLF